MKKLSMIAVALLLAACSSGSDDFPGQAPAPAPAPPAATPPVAAADAFFTRVNGIAASQPDDTEAIDLAAIAITEPEDSEPVPL